MSEDQAGDTARASIIDRIKSSIRSEEADEEARIRSRRRLVGVLTGGFLTANLLMFLRFFFPRTIFEPRTQFRIGLPADFPIGVDTRFQKSKRIWVVRTADRLFVIFASCTHLGCTPDWKLSEAKFKCPCHGSGYDPEGRNYEGPAPPADGQGLCPTRHAGTHRRRHQRPVPRGEGPAHPVRQRGQLHPGLTSGGINTDG